MGKKSYFVYIVHTKGLDSGIHPNEYQNYQMDASAEAELKRQTITKGSVISV